MLVAYCIYILSSKFLIVNRGGGTISPIGVAPTRTVGNYIYAYTTPSQWTLSRQYWLDMDSQTAVWVVSQVSLSSFLTVTYQNQTVQSGQSQIQQDIW